MSINARLIGFLLLLVAIMVAGWSSSSSAEEGVTGAHEQSQGESTVSSMVSPTGAGLVLRVGDRLKINLPGEPEFENYFQVDRDGKIELPELGSILVGGKDLTEVKILLQLGLGQVYRNMETFDVSLEERRLPVTVLGYVQTPGQVDLPIEANIQMAINAAGGLAQGAQMDKMHVRRGDATIPFDYKLYLDTGDQTSLPKLQPLDTIFVPASPLIGNVQVEFDARTLTAAGDGGGDGASITVFGEVHRPGTYSFKDGNNIVDVLMRAGGVTRYAGVEQIRVVNDGTPIPFDLRKFLDTGDPDLMPEVVSGDVIFVPQATEAVKAGARTVYVMGEVFKPGAYEIDASASFLDVLANAGGPTRFAETRSIKVLQSSGTVTAFDLHGYTEGTSGGSIPGIQAGDAILVPEKTDMNEKSWLKVSPDRAIRIIGSVKRPGRYEWADEMSLLDIIAHAGGPSAEADASHIQIISPVKGENDKPITFDFQKFVEQGGDFGKLPEIGAGYTVFVPDLPKDPNDNRSQWVRQSSERSIYIFGAVGAPGRYAFNEELGLLDILSAAQGPTSAADLRNVKITHRGSAENDFSKVNLALYFETGDERVLPKVLPQDVIFIPALSADWLEKAKEKTVRVLGSVARPGRYRFDDTMTILDLLAEAGGTTQDAYDEQILVVNKTLTKPKAHSFNLLAFAKHGDFEALPVVREGDTVYVPNMTDSPAHLVREGLRDLISLITIGSLAFGG